MLSVRATLQSTAERRGILKAERGDRTCPFWTFCAFVISAALLVVSVTSIAVCAPLRPEVAFTVEGLRGGLASHDPAGQLFWAAGSRPRIARGDFNSRHGHDSIVNVVGPTVALEQPHSVAVDIATDKVYWTSYVSGKVRRANVNGSLMEDVVTSGLESPAGIAVGAGTSSGTSWLFWVNRGNGTVQRAHVSSSELLVEPIIETIASPGPYDVHSVIVDPSAGKVYWSLSRTGRIQRSNVDGSGFVELVTGLERPEGLALDSEEGKIYWVDAAAGKVQRARSSDGGRVETLFHSIASPRGVALDLAARKLFWGDLSGSILRANMANIGECVELVSLAFGDETILFVSLGIGAGFGCFCTCCPALKLLVKLLRRRNRDAKRKQRMLMKQHFRAWESWHRITGRVRRSVRSTGLLAWWVGRRGNASRVSLDFAQKDGFAVTPANASTVRFAGIDGCTEPSVFGREAEVVLHFGQTLDNHLPPSSASTQVDSKPTRADEPAAAAEALQDSMPVEILDECGGDGRGWPVEFSTEFCGDPGRSKAGWCLCLPDSR